MSAAGTTPGPWSVGPPHVVARRYKDEQHRRITRFVAEAVLSAPFVEGEREANARLIAKSPQMLELLKEIEESFTADDSYNLLRTACRKLIAEIEA